MDGFRLYSEIGRFFLSETEARSPRLAMQVSCVKWQVCGAWIDPIEYELNPEESIFALYKYEVFRGEVQLASH